MRAVSVAALAAMVVSCGGGSKSTKREAPTAKTMPAKPAKAAARPAAPCQSEACQSACVSGDDKACGRLGMFMDALKEPSFTAASELVLDAVCKQGRKAACAALVDNMCDEALHAQLPDDCESKQAALALPLCDARQAIACGTSGEGSRGFERMSAIAGPECDAGDMPSCFYVAVADMMKRSEYGKTALWDHAIELAASRCASDALACHFAATFLSAGVGVEENKGRARELTREACIMEPRLASCRKSDDETP